ncbi:MAG: hypothetical protein RLZZ127_350 [Planctomycetota bacterium]|jgi:hypothetical protein
MRWRRWLVGTGIAAAVLAAGGGAVSWWLHSRSLIGIFEDAARKRLPVELTIGAVAYHGVDLIELRDIAVSGPVPLLGRRPPPIATIPRALVRMDWGARRPVHIDIDGIDIRLDRERLQALQRIIEAEARIPPAGPAGPPGSGVPPRPPLRITARGSGHLGSTVEIHAIDVALTATGPRFVGTGTAQVAAGDAVRRPFRLAFRTEDRGAARAFAYQVEEGVIPAAPLVQAAAEVGIIPPPGPAVRPWLVALGPVDGRGTVVVSEPGPGRFSGHARLAWAGGGGEAVLALDRTRLALSGLRIDDPSLLRLDGRLDADFVQHRIRIQSAAWSPGPRLGIPAQVPVADLLALLPRLDLDADLAAERTVLGFQGRGQAWLRLESATGAPLRISGGELPLGLARPFMPAWLQINGGLASDGAGGTALSLSVGGGGVQGVVIDLRQARFGAGAWSAGPLDGRLRLVPATAGWAIAAETLGGGGSWTPTARGGRLRLDLPAVEPLVARLQGPVELPDLRGAVAGEALLDLAPGGWRVAVERLRLRRAEMPDLLRGVDVDASGRVAWDDARNGLAVAAEGRLSGGRLRLPGLWIDLAQRSPLATIDARLDAERILTIDRLLARATGPGGQPVPGGWSAELGGRLALRSGDGDITGAIDHADLGWLVSRLPGAEARLVSGEGACTFAARLAGRRLVRVDGAVLPLAAGIDLGPVLRISGVTGAVGFTLAP